MLTALEEQDVETSQWSSLANRVRAAQDGDREAFGALVEQFQATVYAIAHRRLGNTSDALELTQEVFLHVLRRIDQLREPERFAGWLRQVAVRMAINRATRNVAPLCVEVAILEGASGTHSEPVEELIHQERADRLRQALGRLKELDREALDAFYLRGHSLIEIASMLEVPVGTVKRRLHTARKRLRLELEGSGTHVSEWSDFHDAEFERENDDESELMCAGANSGVTWR